MSAGSAPPNPGAPKHNPKVPTSSLLARYPGRWATGIALGVTAYLFLNKPPAPKGQTDLTYRTQGVQNIEKAYTNSGATPTHTKAYGGTKQGEKDSVYLREGGGTSTPTKESPFEKGDMGDDQRPSKPTKVGQIFDNTNLGSAKGK